MFALSYSYNTTEKTRRRSIMSAGSIGSINEGVESLLGTKAVREATASPASESKPNEEISAANSRVDSKSSEEYRESEKAVYASQSALRVFFIYVAWERKMVNMTFWTIP